MTAYSATTLDHFQHPRNVGRLPGASAVGRVDDPATETTVEIYVLVERGRVVRATFRTLGCSACIAASSVATELLTGRDVEDGPPSEGDILGALDGLPPEKRYCASLVARAAASALNASRQIVRHGFGPI